MRTRLEEVERKIQSACKRANRDRSEVTLIAVSKTKPLTDLRTAYDLGLRSFGENKVQEMTEKMNEMPDDVSWHMIGHLQRNKVKYIVGRVSLIHSLDSLRLAQSIHAEAVKKGVTVSVLAEINAADEASKFGIRPEETEDFVREVSKLEGIRVCGLMTIAPYVVDPEENRVFFRKIRDLAVDISGKKINNVSMDILSMGMTGDYPVAIEEGATMVRVGTALFGERDTQFK